MGSKSSVGLNRIDTLESSKLAGDTVRGELKLLKFLTLLEFICYKTPYAAAHFGVNQAVLKKLVINHLPLIVGKEDAAANSQRLIAIVSGKQEKPASLIWVTNRQQGKTTTVSKFIAALMLASPVGGNLVFIYSTSLDRAQEVLRAAKQYIYYIVTTDRPKMSDQYKIHRDNERMISIFNGVNAINTCVARPKRVESCRGDAPAAAFIDEAAFVEEDWFNRFARPLLMVRERRFTLVTTPPVSQTCWFAVFVKQIISGEDARVFEYLNHSLVCERCAEKKMPDKCLHALKYIPPWKSYKGLQALRETVAKKDRVSFLEEVYGMVTEDDDVFFKRDIIDAEVDRWCVVKEPIKQVYVAIDPASHTKSSMGIAAIGYRQHHPELILIASASVPVSSANMDNVVSVIEDLVRGIQNQRYLDTAKLIPIIEVNHSDVVAKSILRPFEDRRSYFEMPFTRERFNRGITPGIGVYTTTAVKQAAVIQFRQLLMDHRLRISKQLIVPTASIFNPTAPSSTPTDAIDLLKDQLAAFKLHQDGSISGKTSAGHDDDQAWALLMALTWAETLRRKN